jgi:DnaK suppressor protein
MFARSSLSPGVNCRRAAVASDEIPVVGDIRIDNFRCCCLFGALNQCFYAICSIRALWPVNCQLRVMPETSSFNELNRFQTILETRIAELERGTRERDGIAVDPSPDQLDEIQRASERAIAISNLDRDAKQLRSARAALRRIREGTFGVCEQCEEAIHPKRLAALPWAPLCIQCQEEADSRAVFSDAA